MSAHLKGSPDGTETIVVAASGDPFPSPTTVEVLTLGMLPTGARLVLRCRKDWRDATVASTGLDLVTLSVGSPSGRTYRVRRPPDSVLTLEGSILLLGEGGWRAGRARYDARW